MGRERRKDGGRYGANVMFVPGNVSGPGHWHQDADTRAGPGPLPSLFSAEGARAGGESVLQQVPGEDPESAQVSAC